VPAAPRGLVLFAHGSGTSRLSPRNVAAADALNAQGLVTLLLDLLTAVEADDRRNVFDIPLLAERVIEAALYLSDQVLPGCQLQATREKGDMILITVATRGRENDLTVQQRCSWKQTSK
jgi:predicted alpha/beta-hydrolase family hydrolase